MAGVQISEEVMLARLRRIMEHVFDLNEEATASGGIVMGDVLEPLVDAFFVEVAGEITGKGRMVRQLRETHANALASAFSCGMFLGNVLGKMPTDLMEKQREAFDQAYAEAVGE